MGTLRHGKNLVASPVDTARNGGVVVLDLYSEVSDSRICTVISHVILSQFHRANLYFQSHFEVSVGVLTKLKMRSLGAIT